MAIISEQISGNTISVTMSSTNLKSSTYFTDEKRLSVTFNNGYTYEYFNVPWDVFTKFRMSKSQGQFFNKEISRSYPYKKIS